MAVRRRGRWADFAADPNVTFKKDLFYFCAPVLAQGTFVWKRKVSAPGVVTYASLYADLNGGTVTLDIAKGGASILDGVVSIGDATTLELEGMGADNSGSQNFDVDTAAKRLEMLYEDGDELTFTVVVATADAEEVLLVVEGYEMNKVKAVADAG